MPEVNGPLGIRRYKWEDDIKMNMKEIGWEGADKIHLTQGGSPWRAVVNISVSWLGKFGRQGGRETKSTICIRSCDVRRSHVSKRMKIRLNQYFI